MDRCYMITNSNDVLSPGLVIYKDIIAENIHRMIEIAGSPDRLRPHVKTHKMREIIAMELAAGITKHKCATIAEAEMLASCGVKDVLIAYQLVGPHQQRLVQLMGKFPECRFRVIVDHLAVARSLAEVISAVGLEIEVLLDIDIGQHRTGIAIGEDAARLYELLGRPTGLRPGGFHVYDGHNKQADPAQREAAVREQFAEVSQFRQELERRGCPVPLLVCGGTPTFPIYAKIPDVECSPGTCVLHDNGYGIRFPDLTFRHAALLLTRVVSRPTPNHMCLDLGYKAVAADPKEDRLVLLDLPDARLPLQNEEHLLVETAQATRYKPGDELYACPTHICPTCALHKEAYVVEGGEVVERWQVAARDRQLEV